ncbi:MAG: alpha/beta hydrolase fold domain-containing protein, partial [Novosphingobium sp.]
MHRKAFNLLAMAALMATSAAHAGQKRVFPVSETPELTDHFPIVPVDFPRGVKGYRDIVYQQINGHVPQVVDIYVPATKGPHPLILYIHGGGWVGGHTRHSGALADFPKVLAALSAEGFVVASLEYRLSGDAKFPAQVQDAKASLRFLRDNAARYRIDASRVGIWGGSAGGHLTALTALSCKEASLDPAAAKDVCASAAVTWYGVFDFAAMAAGRANGVDGAAERLLGCPGRCTAEAYAPASPV